MPLKRCFCQRGITEQPQTDPLISMGYVSLGKSKSGFLYPKTDFAFLYLNPKMDLSEISDLKNPHSEWIHQIKSKSGFLGFMIRAFLWGRIRKNNIWQAVFLWKSAIFLPICFVRWVTWRAIKVSFQCYFIVECTQNFIGSPDFFGELHWGCHAKKIPFRIFRFFGSNESVWSLIKNPILDSPKETHPKSSSFVILSLLVCRSPWLEVHFAKFREKWPQNSVLLASFHHCCTWQESTAR